MMKPSAPVPKLRCAFCFRMVKRLAGGTTWGREVFSKLVGGQNYSDLLKRRLGKSPNGGLVRESHQNSLNSDLGIIVICPGL